MEAESNLDAAMEAQNDALEDRLFSQFFPSGMLGGQAEGSTAPPSESLDNDGSLRGQPAAKFADSQTDRKVTMPKRRMRMIRGPHGGRSKRGWETWGQGHNSADQKGSLASLREELRQLEESVFHMQKLALRHEDYLCAFRPETSYAIFMRLESQPLSCLPCLRLSRPGEKPRRRMPAKWTSLCG